MHVRNGCFGGARRRKDDVGGSAVGVEGAVHGHLYVGDCAVVGKDFLEMCGEYVFCEFFDHNLREGEKSKLVSHWGLTQRMIRGRRTLVDRGMGGVLLLDLLRV